MQGKLLVVRWLLLLQAVKNNFRCNSPILDDAARTANHLASFALLVNLAETGPLAKLLVVVNLEHTRTVIALQSTAPYAWIIYLHEWDVVLLAESCDELLVQWLRAVVS